VAGAFRVSVTLIVLVMPPPVRVMLAAWLPAVKFAVFTLAVMVALFEPDVKLRASHEALSLMVHDPFELTVID
jgi:hypothetical protein